MKKQSSPSARESVAYPLRGYQERVEDQQETIYRLYMVLALSTAMVGFGVTAIVLHVVTL